MSKYQIGQIVKYGWEDEHYIGVILTTRLNEDKDGYEYEISACINDQGIGIGYEYPTPLYWQESRIKCAVKIIELPEEPVYCKDCEHWDKGLNIHASSCPIRQWVIMNVYQGEVASFSEIQPPPNCYCFKKREAK